MAQLSIGLFSRLDRRFVLGVLTVQDVENLCSDIRLGMDIERDHASGEVRRRIELGHHPVFLKAAFTPAAPIQQVSHVEPFAPKPAVRFSSAEAQQQWTQAALDLQPKLAAFGGVYALDPANALPLMAAHRALGFPGRAADMAKQLALTDAPLPQIETLTETKDRCGTDSRLISRRNVMFA